MDARGTPALRFLRTVAATVVLAATAGACATTVHQSAPVTTVGPVATTAGSTPTSTDRPSTTAATTAPPATCTNRAVVDGWPVARRAALLVVAPVLDFNLATVRLGAQAGVGGLLLLGNASPPPDLAGQLAGALGPAGAARPLVMADQEGGGIQRLRGAVTPMPWPRDAAASMSPAQVEALTTNVGRQMRQLGVTVNLAPVLDLDAGAGPSESDPDGLRSFSANAAVTTAYGQAYSRGLEAGGVMPVVKHFPGLGGSTGNTDYGPAATQPIGALRRAGLLPFEAAIRSGAPAVMVANASVPGLTSLPASLSPAAVGGLLRGELGFQGLVLTDSLSAGAITAAGYDLPRAAVAAVEAGGDMVLFGSTLTVADTALLSPQNVNRSIAQIVQAISAAAATGALPASRLDDAAAHVLAARGTHLCPG